MVSMLLGDSFLAPWYIRTRMTGMLPVVKMFVTIQSQGQSGKTECKLRNHLSQKLYNLSSPVSHFSATILSQSLSARSTIADHILRRKLLLISYKAG